MDAFRVLTGGTRLDKKRFQADVAHFEAPKAGPVASTSTALPSELDFFGSTAGDGDAATAEDRKAKKKERKRKRAEEAAGAETAATLTDYPALLRRHKIKLTGLGLPDPVASVDDVVVRRRATGGDAAAEQAELLARNWKSLGLKDPTGVQMAAWGTMLAGRDILACAPTGSGKTFSFIFPLLALLSPSSASTDDVVIRPQAVIIEPTRELAVQVLRETRRLASDGGWKTAVLGEEGVGLATRGKAKDGKKSKGKKGKKEKESSDGGALPDGAGFRVDAAESAEGDASRAEAYKGPVDILITTPLRLVFAIKSGTVSLSSTSYLILDEADKLFELNFLEQTDEILAACAKERPVEAGEIRKGMFSATMPSSVEELAKGVMAGAGSGMVRAIVGHKEAATSTIDQTLSFVNTEDHKLLSLRSMIQGGQFTPPVLIFVQSIQRAKELVNELVFDGINADAIHADRTPQERDEIVRKFAAGQVWCLICTDVMARGVDFKGVKLVINYDFPQSAMSYIHRIGRTGRAGKAGRAVTFFTKADAGHLKTIVNVMRQSGCAVPDWMLALPNPSQDAKKALKMRPLGRKDISKTLGSGSIGEQGGPRKEKTKKRERIMGGKGGIFKKGKASALKGEAGESKGEASASKGERPAKKAKREVALEE